MSILNIDKNEQIKLIAPVMLIVAVKILMNPMFMNKISIDIFGLHLLITESSFLYSLLFILLDISTVIYGTRNTYIIIVIGAIMDGMYSFGVYSTTFFGIPELYITGQELVYNKAIHSLGRTTWDLYVGGLMGSITTYFAEVSIFSYILKRIFKKSFLLSSFFSISLTILVHNAILYPYVIHDVDLMWKIYWSNFLVNLIFILVYTTILNKVFKKIYRR